MIHRAVVVVFSMGSFFVLVFMSLGSGDVVTTAEEVQPAMTASHSFYATCARNTKPNAILTITLRNGTRAPIEPIDVASMKTQKLNVFECKNLGVTLTENLVVLSARNGSQFA